MNNKTIKQIRKDKKVCDYDKFKGAYPLRACLEFDNCVGCGAYTRKRGS